MATYCHRSRSRSRAAASGELPESGAIFMSSRTTKQECFQNYVFGLPRGCADFVKNVTSGMILFLFEYEKRKLYGVFEAVSDGQMDILPLAFPSSPNSYPAQVQFRVIWKCPPLLEDDFRDAIWDNYYQPNKFNFGLSKQQVHRLLLLFDSKRIGLGKAPAQNKARHSTSSVAIDSCDPGRKQGKLHEEIKRVDISPTIFLGPEDYIPLSSPDCCDIEVNMNSKPCVMALYSDAPFQRESALSHLKNLQSAAQENEDNSRTPEVYSSESNGSDLLPKFVQQEDENFFEADESVYKILENLESKHDTWIKMRKNCCSKSFENRNTSVSHRTSVFSRLSFTSESTEQESKVSVFSRLNFECRLHSNDKVKTSSDESENSWENVSKKKRLAVNLANHDIGARV